MDLQQASASQLLTALQQKGYTTIADLSKLAKIDIGVPNYQDVSTSQDDFCPSNVINCLGDKHKTFKARDAVNANTLSGVQTLHEDGNRSEFVYIMTMSYGPQRINVYSDDRRTDSALAIQAKKTTSINCVER